MEVIVFEKDAYYKMLAEMKQSIRDAIREAKAETKSQTKPEEEWIDARQAQKVLNCKKDKLLELRSKEPLIVTSQFGRKISYHLPSLLAFIRSKATNL